MTQNTGMLARKEWTFMTNSETLHKVLNLRCRHHTKHVCTHGTHADKLCHRAAQHILKMERWNLVQPALQQATMTQALAAENENSSEHDEAILSALPANERRALELLTRKRHHNCGHPPNHALMRMLR